MHTRSILGIRLALSTICTIGLGLPSVAWAQATDEQLEADYRVIAARCGSPAFEKAFFKDSKAAVAAGLVVKGRDAAEVEKSVSKLRRSPFVLVAASADCPAQLTLLKDLQKTRNDALRKGRGRK